MALTKFSSLNIQNIQEIDNCFEISSIDEKETFLSRAVRRKIMEKIDAIVSLFSGYLNPDSSIIQMHDAQSLNDSDRVKIVAILKDFLKVEKKHQLLELEGNVENDKEWIQNALKLYKDHLSAIKEIIHKIMISYDAEDIKMDINYLG